MPKEDEDNPLYKLTLIVADLSIPLSVRIEAAKYMRDFYKMFVEKQCP